MANPPDIKEYAQPRAEANGVLWPVFERQIQVESGWEHWSSPGVVKASPSGAMGLGQLNSKYYTPEQWRDPYTNIDWAITIMAGYLSKFGTYRRALAAYNWGPGNVGGYTKSDGTVVPPWDGRRETISAQGARYLDLILGADWKEPTMSAVVYDEYPDPQPAGQFAATPSGVILHGSRSGIAGNPKDKEYLSTARYEVSNPDGLGWNATIGDGRVALHISPYGWGWNARAASGHYLGVEFAQATVDEAITDGQVAALVDWIKTRALVVWPGLPFVFPTHAELDGTAQYGGYHDGKTDVFPKDDPRTDALRKKIMAGLGAQPPVPTPQFAVGPGILAAMQAHGDAPASDELYFKQGTKDEWSEAMGRSGARYIYIASLNRVFKYDPTA